MLRIDSVSVFGNDPAAVLQKSEDLWGAPRDTAGGDRAVCDASFSPLWRPFLIENVRRTAVFEAFRLVFGRESKDGVGALGVRRL